MRHELFNARTTITKEKKRKKHQEIQEKIGDVLVKNSFPHRMAEAIKEWKAFNPNSCAGWFDQEWMFGLHYFDLIIGNPPYIQLQKAFPGSKKLKYADLYKNEGYDTFERTGDIYSLFYEQGLNMLKPEGLLCYITSNKWMRTKYGESLRKYFSKKKPLQLIDMGPGIFEAATVDTNILLIQNQRTKRHALQALTLQSKDQISAIKHSDMTIMDNLNQKSWILLKEEELSILAKIKKYGRALEKWNVVINRGVLTGYNPAFIIDGSLREQLVREHQDSSKIIRPLLRGRDIARFRANFADQWLICTIPACDIDIKKYPVIESHLKQFLPKLNQTGEEFINKNGELEKTRKKTVHEWFETQDPISFWEDFENPKVVWKRIGSVIRFSYSDNGDYSLDSTVIMTGKKVKYLTAILNSKLMIRELLNNSPKTGTGDVIISVQALNPLPVVDPDEQTEQLINNLIDTILHKMENGEDTVKEEEKIDLMVYKLYHLTYEEARIVDPEIPFTRDKYEKADFVANIY